MKQQLTILVSLLWLCVAGCGASSNRVKDDTGKPGAPHPQRDADPGGEPDASTGERTGDRCPSTGGEMVLIPAGSFLFGPDKTEVQIPYDFCIDRTEVKVAALKECLESNGCAEYEKAWMCDRLAPEKAPYQCFEGTDDYPANWIDWYEAESFCRWAGKRLPSSAEWEKAARGEDGRTYPWGEIISCDHAHYNRGKNVYNACSAHGGLSDRPAKVGSYPLGASPYGALDMTGNVKEWLEYREDVTKSPDKEGYAMSRGGAYKDGDWMVNTYVSDQLLGPGVTTQGHGIRCAADVIDF